MLSSVIFKANDIRGITESDQPEWDADGARDLGAALVDTLELSGQTIVMGRDMRASGPEMSAAFADGVIMRGASVVDIGLCSTDQLYFASGHLHLPGIMFTASHNPANYNGIKFCGVDAAPLDPGSLVEIAARAATPARPGTSTGTIEQRDLLAEYAAHLHSLVDLSDIRPLKVVVDAGNGMSGLTAPAVLGDLPVDVHGLFMDLDGSFPNHQPNPLEPQNLVDAQTAVKETGADCALVFDGDADRCFVIDERGEVISPSVITAMIARAELESAPGSTIVVNTITSRVVADTVAELGGTLAVSRVGHTYVKALMKQTDAVFGGEHSAHYYFHDFWRADTGMLAALHVLSRLGRQEGPLSALVERYQGWVPSGEINSTVDDAKAVIARVAADFESDGEVSHPDGLLVQTADWWVSVRASNTEPLLRLNVEATDEATMVALRDRALTLIRA